MPSGPFAAQNRDMLQDCVEMGRKYGLEVIPWFEYGLKVPANHPLFKQKPEWFTSTNSGTKTRQDGISVAYLNPSLPAVRQFLSDMVVDTLTRYEVDGIQFDDHFSLWHEFGYDSATLDAFKKSTNSPTLPGTKDKAWQTFRAGQITDTLAQVIGAARRTRPGLVVSLSSNKYPWSLEQHLQDWPAWIRRGLADEFVLQNYHASFDTFRADLLGYKQTIDNSTKPPYTVMGLLSGIKTRRVPALDIEQRIHSSRAEGYGVAFFFYASLFELIPSGETPTQREGIFLRQFASPSYPRRPGP